MFRCPITGKQSKANEKPVSVILQRREREYWDTPDRRAPAPPPAHASRDEMERYKDYHVIGRGWEIVQEVYVSRDAANQITVDRKRAEQGA